jgi:hypothetical protein
MSIVYFIGDHEMQAVKIGYTSQPVEQRLFQIQCSSPHKLALLAAMPGTQEDELRFHQQYAHLRIHREWFRLDEVLRGLIEVIAGWPKLPEHAKQKLFEMMRNYKGQ